ncbi:MAG: translocation/assembly module TamB domain-containing protein [Microcoleus vaginatus WJT46-NPBG5]|jgi:translocation and assembly module TamB|nr:translocation/assembly module TamB domain-containing protein [Microcoleus vaginatus WJT46-NPBG5]
MTNSPNSGNQPEPTSNRRRWPVLLKRTGIALGLTLGIGAVAGGGYVWYFVNNKLAPLVEKELTETLQRPVQLGQVNRFTPAGLRFGPSRLPPTATDPDRASVEAVEIGFNILQLLATRNLILDITLVKPDVYIEQDPDGQWITVPKLVEREASGPIRTEIDTIRVRNANVVLLPSGGREVKGQEIPGGVSVQPPAPGQPNPAQGQPTNNLPPTPNTPITFTPVNGSLQLRDRNQRFIYDVTGQPTTGGSFNVAGNTVLPSLATNLNIQARDFLAVDLDRLLKRTVTLPIALYAGKLDGSLEVKVRRDEQADLRGTAQVKGVTAKIDPLPQPLFQTNGQLQFAGQNVGVQNVTTIYGKVPAQAQGFISLKESSNLAIQVPPVSVKDALEALTVEIPFTTEGIVKASIQVTGQISDPVVTGTVTTPEGVKSDKPPLLIDKVNLDRLSAGFKFTPGLLALDNIRATPTVGGQVTGEGTIRLGLNQAPPVLNIVFQGEKLPGDALAQLYNIPAPINIGQVTAAGEIVGPNTKLQTTVRWQAPQAAYPAKGTAIVVGESVLFRDTVATVAGGTVAAQGQLVVGKAWEATVEPLGLALSELPEVVANVSPDLEVSDLQNLNNLPGRVLRGRIRLSGPTENASAETVEASGSAIVSIAGGSAEVSGELNQGQWQASVAPSGLEVDQLAQIAASVSGEGKSPISQENLASLQGQVTGGELSFSGPIAELTPATIDAEGNLSLRVAGGTANVTGQLDGGQWQASVEGSEVQISRFLPDNLSRVGPVSGRVNLSGTTDSLTVESINAEGAGNLTVAGGTLSIENVRVAEGRWQASVDANQLALNPFLPESVGTYGRALGRFTGSFDLAGSTSSFAANTVSVDGSGSLAVADGSANVTVATNQGQWRATVAANQVPLTPFLPNQAAAVAGQLGRFDGTFNLSGNTESFAAEKIRVDGSGSLAVAGGSADLSVATTNGRWQATVAAAAVPVAPFLPAQAAGIADELGQLTGTFNLSGRTDSLTLAAINATGSGRLGVAGGTVDAQNIRVANGQWQANVEPTGVQLSRFNPDLRGLFSGDLNVSGSLTQLTPAAIRAQGDVRFSEGVAIVTDPLTAAIVWDGKKVQINQATAPGLDARGFLYAQLEGAGAPQLTGIDLNVQASKFNLKNLPLDQLPDAVAFTGLSDFTGRITGSPSAPQVVGDVRVYDFVLNQVAFEPVLNGSVNYAAGKQVNLQLAGSQDQIAFNLDENNLPTNFLVRRAEAFARGTRTGNRLQLNVEQFPLTALKLPAPAIAGPGFVTGNVSGNFDVNLGNYIATRDVTSVQLAGAVKIDAPRVGYIKADSFEGQLSFVNGAASLTGGNLQIGESQYLLAGSVTAGPNPQYQAQVSVAQGKLQQILTSLQVFRLQDLTRGTEAPDYASGADVAPVGVGLPNADLLTQLRRFSEIDALLDQQRTAREESSPLPDLAELDGTFGAQINVAGSLQTGVEEARFQVLGQDWNWGRYTVDRVVVDGSFDGGVLTLLPLRFERGETLVAFSGKIGGENQSGQLQVQNFPVEPLQEFAAQFVQVPIDVTGKLNAKATLGGSLLNPQAIGEIRLEEGTLNQTPIETAQASFSYSQARLDFGATAVVSGPDPIQVVGSVPFPALPGNDQINVAVNVQNEGLALLNVLSGQEIRWVDGQGQVQVRVEGTLNAPTITGVAQVQNATLEARLLPEPLTDVTGRVLFNRDRIVVEGIQGQFSDGQVVAQGVLPIAAELAPDDPGRQNPLRISLDRLAVNLKGLYRGGVTGLVGIGGTALQPVVSGRIQLNDGQVLLAEAAARGGGGGAGGGAGGGGGGPEVSFNQLVLVLGDNLRITRQPVLNFQATGNLTINGPLYDLQPRGTISLERGEVNLFTTQFRLDGGYPQTATFNPGGGLDPYLDVRLAASVAEVRGSRQPITAGSSEINDAQRTGFGEAQTVRIIAKVEGPASQLFDNLELTSSPGRSESEIVALLGGGFVNTLGRGDTTLAIANLAGSALLSPIESVLGRALGLSEFRLFPTITTKDGTSSSSLDLAAEAGFDITRNISASILRVLTDDQPTDFSLRYRLNEQLLLRGSTDFSGESRATVEYDIRF